MGTHFYAADITYGRHTYGQIFAHRGTIRVGNFCSIANGVRAIINIDHRKNWVTTYPFGHKWKGCKTDENILDQKDSIIIENDVWIGEDVILLHDTVIRNGAVIGSNAVVCGEIPPYAIAVGNPAKVIDYRFTPQAIEFLLRIKWWDWDDDKIREFIPMLCSSDVAQFIRNARS